MGRYFNTTGSCDPRIHYMVDLQERLGEIKTLVDRGEYFTINRARQYGKTTTLSALAQYLKDDYVVISLDFQMMSNADFADEAAFTQSFTALFLEGLDENIGVERIIPQQSLDELTDALLNGRISGLRLLFMHLKKLCGLSAKPLVLIIDEVDSATNNQVFLDFLAQLRAYFLARTRKGSAAFWSVILAGVYDVKNIRRKIRPDEEHKMNSPWNTHEGNEPGEGLHSSGDCPWDQMVLVPFDIAADFDVDMSLTQDGILGMLREYEADHHTGMDTEEMAGLLYDYTSGYPYLVSRLCKLMDEKIEMSDADGGKENAWTKQGFLQAVRMLLSESNTLFESLITKLADYPELDKMLGELLFLGKTIMYSSTNQAIQLAAMFGFIKNEDGKVVPSNRIFDTLLYNHYLSMDELHDSDLYKASLKDKNQFLAGGRLNMRRILEKFTEHFHELYGNSKEYFVEEEGRRYFLLYLRPIINGTGNYYIESRTRSLGRTDLIVDYRGEQFVVEMKIWRGNEYNIRGESQLSGYLEDYHLSVGYMVSFNFNKKKHVGVQEIMIGNKMLIEAVV